VQAAVVFTGLACGALLAAVGLALWGGLRKMPGFSRAVEVTGWLAGALLLIGALLAWQEYRSPCVPIVRLSLMAALAAPPGIRHRHHSSRAIVMLILPALVLSGDGLFWSLETVEAEPGRLLVAPVELTILVCGGLGARALGEALSEVATATPQIEWPCTATYALLTLLMGGTALMNLWQRGSVWGGTASESGLAGAWLAWNAARLAPRQPARLRAGLTVVAALLLISTVLKCA